MDNLFTDENGDPLLQIDIDKKNKERDKERQLIFKNWERLFKNVFGTPDGEDVMWHILNVSGFLKVDPRNSADLYRDAGRREIGQYLWDMIGPQKSLESMISARNRAIKRKDLKEKN